jgi:hypothetical protein
MNPDSFDLELPTGAELPPPPPMERDAMVAYNLSRLADFYQSPHYEAWLERSWKSKTMGEPFVWID